MRFMDSYLLTTVYDEVCSTPAVVTFIVYERNTLLISPLAKS